MIWIKKQTINPEVTDYYLEIIGEAYTRLGEEVRYFKHWDECSAKRNDIIVVTRYKELLKMVFQKRRYVYWVQGLLTEENFALYHSKLRVLFYNCIERTIMKSSLKNSRLLIMVSKRMKKHYEEKYNLMIKNCYIMPCNNDVIHEESFKEKDKYENEIFCYAGGLNVWQCIDETLSIYKQIEDSKKNTKLLLLVKDFDLAVNMLKKHDIKNYEIDFVSVDQLPQKLKDVKYGFIVREDLELNRVATPTKLMTYMGNGVIPILSDCLEGLLENLESSEYVVRLKNAQDINPIYHMMDRAIDTEKILDEYKRVYTEHYDSEMHITRMMEVLPRSYTN